LKKESMVERIEYQEETQSDIVKLKLGIVTST